jgi:hypothetical protein
MFGKKVQEGVITGTDTPINTSALALGYYAIRLEIGDQLFTLPFVKM